MPAFLPAFLLVSWFHLLLPAALGFAASELLPDCPEKGGLVATAWGVMAGLCAMLWLGKRLGG